jgi:hypothetical protein
LTLPELPEGQSSDDPSIEGHHGLLRHSTKDLPDLKPKYDPVLGRMRAPTPAFLLRQDRTTGEWEKTLSVDLEEELQKAALPRDAHARENEYLARCTASEVRKLGLGAVRNPIPGNDQHGGITGIDPEKRNHVARALARASTVID